MIDIIGTIYNNDGAYDDEGNQISAPTAMAGYHVNSNEYVQEWGDKLVEPATPRRVFAGVKTYFYTFTDKAEFEAFDLDALTFTPEPKEELPQSNVISTIAFKLLFTPEERVAIKTSDDPIVQDFYEIVQDQRLTELDLNAVGVTSAIAYLAEKGIIDDASRFL